MYTRIVQIFYKISVAIFKLHCLIIENIFKIRKILHDQMMCNFLYITVPTPFVKRDSPVADWFPPRRASDAKISSSFLWSYLDWGVEKKNQSTCQWFEVPWHSCDSAVMFTWNYEKLISHPGESGNELLTFYANCWSEKVPCSPFSSVEDLGHVDERHS